MADRQVALITGGSRGIGRGIALALAGVGYDVAINHFDPDETAAEQTRKEIEALSRKCRAWKGDISSASDRADLLENVRREFGRLDLLVNNAGVAPLQRVDMLEATEESFDRLIGINLKGPYFLTQAVADWMIEQRKADPDRALSIINISSISAYTSSPSRGEYCISKAAVSMMTKLYADRLAECNINVYEIQPGIIATDMTAGVKDKYDKLIAEGVTPIKRWGTPEDIGKAVAAIAQGLFPFSTGQVFNVDGGFHLRRL
ncbi:MAG: 3-ketoacyl-ACP reductase [Armatimonadota bacterium]|nr:3-ketoacyl-ACP reductase [Armatimonadota bacterium]